MIRRHKPVQAKSTLSLSANVFKTHYKPLELPFFLCQTAPSVILGSIIASKAPKNYSDSHDLALTLLVADHE